MTVGTPRPVPLFRTYKIRLEVLIATMGKGWEWVLGGSGTRKIAVTKRMTAAR